MFPPHKRRRINFVEPPRDSPSRSAHATSRRAMDIVTQGHKAVNMNRYVYAGTPPSISELLETMDISGIYDKIYRHAFYSNDNDIPERPREYGGVSYHLKGNEESLENLDDWKEQDIYPPPLVDTFTGSSTTYSSGWEYSGSPPSVRQVKNYLDSKQGRIPSKKPLEARSQVSLCSSGLPSSIYIRGCRLRVPLKQTYMDLKRPQESQPQLTHARNRA